MTSRNVERWDPQRRKFVLYDNAEAHSMDCLEHPFDRIPKLIFLDTSVINAIVKFPEHIFEQAPIPDHLDNTLARDVESLMHIFAIGARANWSLAASQASMDEVTSTPQAALRSALQNYTAALFEPRSSDQIFAAKFARRAKDSSLLAALPDAADRELVANAIGLGCDVFCTRDRATIINRRDRLFRTDLRVFTPEEWWACIRPWAGLWG